MHNYNQLFKQPAEQYDRLHDEISQKMSTEFAEYLTDFINHKADEKFEFAEVCIDNHFHTLEEIVTLAKEADTDEDVQECIQYLLFAVNPKTSASELKQILSFAELGSDYRTFIKEMSSQEHGQNFLRYQLDEAAVKFITNGLLTDSRTIISTFKKHTDQVVEYITLLKRSKKFAGAKLLAKIGSSIVGHHIAGPLGSIASRKILGHFLDDSTNIEEALGQVEDFWIDYLNELEVFIQNLKESYKHILLTLYGGTILRVNGDFQSIKLRMVNIDLLINKYHLAPTASEEKRIISWALHAAEQIRKLFAEKEFDKAVIAANRFYQSVTEHPIMRHSAFTEEQCLIYVVTLYKFAAHIFYAIQLRKQDSNAFLTYVNKLYNQLPITLNDDDFVHIGAVTQTELLMYAISDSLESNQETIYLTQFDYMERMLARWDDSNSILYNGEQQLDSDKHKKFLILLTMFCKSKFKIYHPFIDRCNEMFVPLNLIKELVHEYKNVCSKDPFYKYALGVYIGGIAGQILILPFKPFLLIGKIFNRK